jgi:hypothetical protein
VQSLLLRVLILGERQLQLLRQMCAKQSVVRVQLIKNKPVAYEYDLNAWLLILGGKNRITMNNEDTSLQSFG